MIVVNPYLNFQGNTEEAFNFYKSVFGGEFIMLMRFKETAEAEKMSAEDGEKIMHVALALSKHTTLMGTDSMESMGQKLSMGNNFYLSIHTDSRAEADRLFNALSADGKIEMPMTDMFWGDYWGSCADKFGVQWMFSFNEKNMPQ